MGDKYMTEMKSFKISIPTDDAGFVGRACDSIKCKQYFKIYLPDHKTVLYCPYCGQAFDSDLMLTKEQTDYALKVAMEEVRVDLIADLQNSFKKIARNSKALSYKPGPRPVKREIQPEYNERELDSELKCPDCDTRFQVYGIFGYCPGCRSENIQIYDANWAIIKSEIVDAPGNKRKLRHAYNDLVSTFEIFCQRKAKHIISESTNFQNLFDARKFFKIHAKVDILANLTEKEKLTLRRVFQKRHICIHSNSIITNQYVKKIPEDSALIGTQVQLSLQELEEGAIVMRVVMGELVKTVESPGK
jgi:uncharacterized Zn-finger protein